MGINFTRIAHDGASFIKKILEKKMSARFGCSCYTYKMGLTYLGKSQPAFTCSKSTIEALEQGVKYVQCRSGIFIVNFEHISHLALVFLLLTFNM